MQAAGGKSINKTESKIANNPEGVMGTLWDAAILYKRTRREEYEYGTEEGVLIPLGALGTEEAARNRGCGVPSNLQRRKLKHGGLNMQDAHLYNSVWQGDRG